MYWFEFYVKQLLVNEPDFLKIIKLSKPQL